MNTTDHTTPPLNNNSTDFDYPGCRRATKRAWRKMEVILFRPFNFEKWLILAICVWFVNLFEDYSQSFSYIANFQTDQFKEIRHSNIMNKINIIINDPNSFTQSQIGLSFFTVSMIILFAIIFIVIVVIILLWLKSRFEFIFLNNLKYNIHKISTPWSYYKSLGNSCFGWIICYQIICFIISFIVFIIFLLTMVSISNTVNPSYQLISILIICTAVFFLLFTLIYIIIYTFYKYFVITIMYKQEIKVLEAWRTLIDMIRNTPGLFIKFLLVLLMYKMIATVIVLLIVICTCCILGCVFSVPIAGKYIYSLIFLPIFVFLRLFGIEFLAQFGKRFDMQVMKDQQSVSSDQ